jgi:hypothetical protein
MDRDFRKAISKSISHAAVRFAASAARRLDPRVLRQPPISSRATIVIYLPGKLATQFLCYLLDVPFEVCSPTFLLISDLLLAPWLSRDCLRPRPPLPQGQPTSLVEALRWGRRQWLKTLANKIKVEITITLWGALLVIPGIVAMVRLIFVDVIVAIDADVEDDVLGRSRKLAQGRRWHIFFVLLPMLILDLAAMFLVLDRVQAVTHSRTAFAVADSVLAVGGQLETVAALLMYLGTAQKRVTKLKP